MEEQSKYKKTLERIGEGVKNVFAEFVRKVGRGDTPQIRKAFRYPNYFAKGGTVPPVPS